MNNIFTLIFLIIFGMSYAQSEEANNLSNCETGTKRAIEDAKKKIFKSYDFGTDTKTKEELKFSEFYQKYMKSKYRIYIKDDCKKMPDSECYAKTMNELIKKEFGEHIFERSKEEAKEIYSKT